MSVPDHQIDPPEVTVGIDPGNGDHHFVREALEWPRFDVEALTNFEFYQDENITLINQIMTIFTADFPLEDNAYRWWKTEYEGWDGFHIPNTHEKRTRYYLETYPWWKLWKINKKLEEEKLSPTIDHPRSDIMIGKSKAAAAYYQHNDNFKKFISELEIHA